MVGLLIQRRQLMSQARNAAKAVYFELDANLAAMSVPLNTASSQTSTKTPSSGSCLSKRRAYPTDLGIRVGNGGTVVDPTVVARLLKNQADRSPRSALSARETEVLALMAEGRSNRAISDRLFVGEKTVESHVASISPSLGCCQPLMTTGGFLPSSLTSGSQARPDWSPRRLRPLAPAGDGSRPAR